MSEWWMSVGLISISRMDVIETGCVGMKHVDRAGFYVRGECQSDRFSSYGWMSVRLVCVRLVDFDRIGF